MESRTTSRKVQSQNNTVARELKPAEYTSAGCISLVRRNDGGGAMGSSNDVKLVRLSEKIERRRTGDIIYRTYACPCGRGIIEEEQDYTSGHRDDFASLHCKYCEGKYAVDFGHSGLHWILVDK